MWMGQVKQGLWFIVESESAMNRLISMCNTDRIGYPDTCPMPLTLGGFTFSPPWTRDQEKAVDLLQSDFRLWVLLEGDVELVNSYLSGCRRRIGYRPRKEIDSFGSLLLSPFIFVLRPLRLLRQASCFSTPSLAISERAE